MEALGFDFHTLPSEADPVGIYWDESAHWVLSAAEVDLLEEAAEELHRMCLQAVDRVVAEGRYEPFGLTPRLARVVSASWRRAKAGKGDLSLYGRFDLAYGGAAHGDGRPKLLEYNADTPTSLYEAAVAQWVWLEDVFPEGDQFNSLHEGLVERWRELVRTDGSFGPDVPLHLTCAMPHREDEGTLRYLQDTATEAGLATKVLGLGDLGWTEFQPHGGGPAQGCFTDLEEVEIRRLFKLTPWEWLVEDPFGQHLLDLVEAGRIQVLEPAWKMLLSNKALLALLWEMFPGHPYLVEAHLDRTRFTPGTKVIAKPLLGREGASISVATLGEGERIAGAPELETPGPYGAEGYVYQAWSPVVSAPGPGPDGTQRIHHAVIGAWIVGDRCRGIGIREDVSAVTRDTSRFVPHRFE